MIKPATICQDAQVYNLWANGTPPKNIMESLNLTRHQVYDGIVRHRKNGKNRKK